MIAILKNQLENIDVHLHQKEEESNLKIKEMESEI